MKKYKRISIEIRAKQYFPYDEIEIDGFRNVVEELLDGTTMQKVQVVRKAEIVQGDQKLEIGPGDWVIQYPDESIDVRSHRDFITDYEFFPE